MKHIALAIIMVLFASVAAFAANGFVTYGLVSTGTTTLSSSTNYDATKSDISCMFGPVETNSVRVTWSTSSSPTTTVGHLIPVGSAIVLKKSTTVDAMGKTTYRDEVSTFKAIATSGTSTVPCTCN